MKLWAFWRGSEKSKAESQKESGRIPRIEELTTHEKVQNAVFAQTTQAPITVFPLAIGTAAVVWSGMIDFSPQSLAVALLGLGGGAAAWVVNYYFRGESYSKRYVEKCRREIKEAKSLELERLKTIQDDCYNAGFAEGFKEAGELTTAFEGLQSYLNNRDDVGHLQVKRFLDLSKETYQQGISLLSQALELYKGLGGIDLKGIMKELKDWEKKRKKLKKDDVLDRERCNRQIETFQKRVERYAKSEERIAALLAQANELETALLNSRSEIVDLMERKASGLDSSVADIGQTSLEKQILAARRVEERLGNLSESEDHESDLMYIEAGRNSRNSK